MGGSAPKAPRFFIMETRDMSERVPGWLPWAAVGVVLGLGVGIAIGWWLWPVTYTNTAPDALRDDYHDDYVLMVAATYEVEQDVREARSRLRSLNHDDPLAPVLKLRRRLIAAGGGKADIARLTDLAQALGAGDASLTPAPES
jgi:hypothetical protein